MKNNTTQKQNKSWILNTKILLILTILILNALVFGYFYREIKILRENIGVNILRATAERSTTEDRFNFIEVLKTKNEELAKKVEELEKRDTEIAGRVRQLEKLIILTGETLKSCEFLSKAYPRMPSYENEFKQCENNYNKLKGSF